MLTTCPECQGQVSSTAATCPKCGAPVSQRDTGTGTINTVQLTGKPLKAQVVWSQVTFWGGLVFALCAAHYTAWCVLGWLVCVAGLAWYITTRVRIWWHHK